MQLYVQNKKAISNTLGKSNCNLGKKIKRRRKEAKEADRKRALGGGGLRWGFLPLAPGPVLRGLMRKVMASATLGGKGPWVWDWLSKHMLSVQRSWYRGLGDCQAW